MFSRSCSFLSFVVLQPAGVSLSALWRSGIGKQWTIDTGVNSAMGYGFGTQWAGLAWKSRFLWLFFCQNCSKPCWCLTATTLLAGYEFCIIEHICATSNQSGATSSATWWSDCFGIWVMKIWHITGGYIVFSLLLSKGPGKPMWVPAPIDKPVFWVWHLAGARQMWRVDRSCN